MRNILYFHTGSANHGCEALVRSTAKLLGGEVHLFSSAVHEDRQYDVDLVAEIHEDITEDLKRKPFFYYLSAIPIKLWNSTELNTKLSHQPFLRFVKKGDLCFSIGGDNYCYGAVEILSDLNTLIHKQGGKTILWGCSIDPEVITPEIAKNLMEYDLITVRESITQAALKAAGVENNVKPVADPAFLLDIREIPLPEGFIPGHTIGLNLSPLILKYADKKETALESFYKLVEEILETTQDQIALIPHVTKKGNSDLEVLEPLFHRFKDTKRVLLIPDMDCMALKYIISQCRLFIGARTHATIAAYSTLVPTMVIGYSVKSRGIAVDLFGTEENYVVPIQTVHHPNDLIAGFHWLDQNEQKIREDLHRVIPPYKEKARNAKMYVEAL